MEKSGIVNMPLYTLNASQLCGLHSFVIIFYSCLEQLPIGSRYTEV